MKNIKTAALAKMSVGISVLAIITFLTMVIHLGDPRPTAFIMTGLVYGYFCLEFTKQ